MYTLLSQVLCNQNFALTISLYSNDIIYSDISTIKVGYMKYSNLIPGIERRLDTWIQVHENLDKRTEIALKYTITLSREYGCEAYPLAEKLSQDLYESTGEEWNIFDHAVIEEISKNESVSKDFLNNLGDASQIFDIVMANMVNNMSQSEAYDKIVHYITKVALLGNAIIVGRGSSIITQNFKNCYHFRLEAPKEFRVESIATRMGTTKEEAKRLILENETIRNKFITKHFGQKIDDKNLYNAIFNNERTTVDQMAHSIEALMQDLL